MERRCLSCGAALSGRQAKYCGRVCKNVFNNQVYQSYKAQQKRGRERKIKLIEIMGGACLRCGYAANYAAMELHHVEPEAKLFTLDLRSLSNRSWNVSLKEAQKCMLLCSNCHAEEHNPGCFFSL